MIAQRQIHEPPLGGRQRGPARPSPVRHRFGAASGVQRRGGQTGRGPVPVDVLEREVVAPPAEQRDRPHGQDGIAAEVKDVGLGTDPGQAQRAGPQLDDGIDQRTRPSVIRRRSGFGRSPGRRPAARRPIAQRRTDQTVQRRAVQLSVESDRERGHRQDRGGYRVVGQPIVQVRAQAVDVCGAGRARVGPCPVGPTGEADRGDELVATENRPDRDRGRQHAGPFVDRPFDLGRVDPVAPDLHLTVGPAQEHQRSVGPAPAFVSAAVHPHPTRDGEGRRGQLRTVRVAQADAAAADQQFAGGVVGVGCRARIEAQHGVADGTADRHHGLVRRQLIDPFNNETCCTDSGFRRAIVIDEPAGDTLVQQGGGQWTGQRLTAQQQGPQWRVAGGTVGQQGHQVRRGGLQVGDRVVGQGRPERLRVAGDPVRDHLQAAGRGHRQQPGRVAQVRGQRGDMSPPALVRRVQA